MDTDLHSPIVPEIARLKQPASPKTCWLFVDNFDAFGGHEIMMLRLMHELKRQGHVTPQLLARQGSRLHDLGAPFAANEAFAKTGSNRPMPRVLRRLASLRHLLRDARALWQAWRTARPRICVFASGYLLAQPGLVMLARVFGARVAVYVPLLGRFTEMEFPGARMKDRFVRHLYAKVPDAWITITGEQAEHFRRWAGPRGPIFTLPNTVAPEVEDAGIGAVIADAPPRGEPSTPVRVLVFGRLDAHQKGLDILLEHLAGMSPALRQRLRVSIVGEGAYGPVIAARLQAEPELRAFVELSPWADAVQSMREHDVLLLPSRFEGVPLVMLEAMALGLPVVATDLPGTRAYLPRSCLFPVGQMSAAFDIVMQLAVPRARVAVVESNRAAFEAKVSREAFSNATRALTHGIERCLQGREPISL